MPSSAGGAVPEYAKPRVDACNRRGDDSGPLARGAWYGNLGGLLYGISVYFTMMETWRQDFSCPFPEKQPARIYLLKLNQQTTMSQHPRQTLIYSPNFRWNDDHLEQEVQIIQHYPEADRDVGLYRKWIPVNVEGKPVGGLTLKHNRILQDQVERLQKDLKEFQQLRGPDTSYLDRVVPVSHGVGRTYHTKPTTTHGAAVPEGYILVEFDGGSKCNIPAQGYGEGYGSFQIDHGEIHRVKLGPMSSNAAEIYTLAAALELLSSPWDGTPMKLFIRGDSQIALKWATEKGEPKAKNSEEFKKAIAVLRTKTVKFADIKTEWRTRRHSVKLFGH